MSLCAQLLVFMCGTDYQRPHMSYLIPCLSFSVYRMGMILNLVLVGGFKRRKPQVRCLTLVTDILHSFNVWISLPLRLSLSVCL